MRLNRAADEWRLKARPSSAVEGGERVRSGEQCQPEVFKVTFSHQAKPSSKLPVSNKASSTHLKGSLRGIALCAHRVNAHPGLRIVAGPFVRANWHSCGELCRPAHLNWACRHRQTPSRCSTTTTERQALFRFRSLKRLVTRFSIKKGAVRGFRSPQSRSLSTVADEGHPFRFLCHRRKRLSASI